MRRLLTEGDAQKLSIWMTEQACNDRRNLPLPILARGQDEGCGLLKVPARGVRWKVFPRAGKEPIALQLEAERRCPIEVGLKNKGFLQFLYLRQHPLVGQLPGYQVYIQAGV